MKKVIAIALLGLAIYFIQGRNGQQALTPAEHAPTPGISARNFDQSNSGGQISGQGVVVKVLSDDTSGSRHQRFILRLQSGQTLLVAHNIDLAPHVDGLKSGDVVFFSGEYQWNDKGGVLHWTHADPQGRHTSGWLKHDGHTYQ